MLVLIDLAPPDGRAPLEQERILLDELLRYRPELLERPRIIVGSKADAAEPDVVWDGRRFSAITGDGLRQLVGDLATLVQTARSATSEPESYVVHTPEPEGVRVERADDGAFVVMGRSAERAVAVSDLTNAQALTFVQQRLKRAGVDRALARAGAREGDTVRIGAFTFEYERG